MNIFKAGCKPLWFLIAAASCIVVSQSAFADATFTVNVSYDDDVPNVDGICNESECTLREAIHAANNTAGNDTIVFASTVTGTINLRKLLPNLTTNITIIGPGPAVLAISGQRPGSTLHVGRVFYVGDGTTHISRLTIRDGELTGEPGGGIYNQATLTLTECVLSGNTSVGADNTSLGGTGGTGYGGAIVNYGTLTVNGCTFSGNRAIGGKGGDNPDNGSTINTGGTGGEGNGGAIFNIAGQSLVINSCTFSGNTAQGGVGGNAHFGGSGGASNGGAVFNQGTMVMTAATVSGNRAVGGAGGDGAGFSNDGLPGNGSAGGLLAFGGTSTVQNTICAGNTATGGGIDVQGVFTSGGYNLIGSRDGNGSFNFTGDQGGTNAVPLNPRLSALENHGGQTPTMAPGPGSPALDKGKSFGLTTDQRGQPRIFNDPAIAPATAGDNTDIGALEVAAVLQSGITFVVNILADHSDGACSPTNCTLREAISTANAFPGANIVAFKSGMTGTIQLTTVLPNLATDMTLQGPGLNVIRVRGEGVNDPYRIFTVANGTNAGPTVSINGLTIANGFAAGGGIRNDGGKLSVNACLVTGNGGGEGGGILNYATEGSVATLSVQNSTIAANRGSLGGGISNNGFGGTAILGVLNCAFNDNTTFAPEQGGGIYNSSAFSNGTTTVTVQNSTFKGNRARDGGGIHHRGSANSGPLTVRGCTFTGNITNVAGGGVYIRASKFIISDSTFTGNTAGFGGGVYTGGSGPSAPLTLQNSTFSGNTAGYGAGGYNSGSGATVPLMVQNCTFSANTSPGYGGALYNHGASPAAMLKVINSTLSGNTATTAGGGIYNYGASATTTLANTILKHGATGVNLFNDAGGTIASDGHNLSSDGSGATDLGTGLGGFLTGTGDQRNTDPKLDPGGLKSNGGPTQTIAIQATSTALNNAVNAPARDQRHFVRKGPADIGAFELGGMLAPRTDFNVDGFTDYLLFNPSTRATAIWYLQGTAFSSSKFGPTLPAGWAIGAVADFDFNDSPDYLLFNLSTGQTAVWFLSNATFLRATFGPTLPAGWSLLAAVDFNNNGTPDLLFYNPGSGQTAIWFLNGTGFVGSAIGPAITAGWTLVDAADLNADGKPDFVLSNPSNQQTAIWYLNGATRTGSAFGPTLPAGWTLEGASDFNNNGNPDFVLYEASTRKTAIWFLNGVTHTSSAYGPTIAAGYQLEAP